MPERSNEEIVRRYWHAHAAHDHKTVSELRHPDWLAEWPQSGERVRGDGNDRAIMDNYPGGEPHLDATHRIVGAEDRWVVTPAYTVQRVIGNGDAWWGSGIGTYPDGTDLALRRDGRAPRRQGLPRNGLLRRTVRSSAVASGLGREDGLTGSRTRLSTRSIRGSA